MTSAAKCAGAVNELELISFLGINAGIPGVAIEVLKQFGSLEENRFQDFVTTTTRDWNVQTQQHTIGP